MIENSNINEIFNKIALKLNPDKIILFGSFATGDYDDDSDLDLIIVKESDLPKHKRGIEVRRLFYGMLVPMDLKIYIPKEFDKELNNKYSFLNTAIKDSKTLYERED